MKRNLILIIVGIVVAFATLAATKGPKNSAIAYPINGDYSKLVVSAAFDVSFSDTAKQALATIPESLRNQVVVDVEKGTLHIALRGKSNLKERPTIMLPRNDRINDIELTGAAKLEAGKLENDEMRIYLTGEARFRGNIVAKEVNIEQAGASNYYGYLNVENIALTLTGASTADIRGRALFKMKIDLIEGSNLDAEKFEVRRIEGSLDGASTAILWCTERMVVPVRNASHLTYIGHPLVVNCSTTDVSTVTHKR